MMEPWHTGEDYDDDFAGRCRGGIGITHLFIALALTATVAAIALGGLYLLYSLVV